MDEQTVMILDHNGVPIAAPVYAQERGLAVTYTQRGCYTVTHLASGRAVWLGWPGDPREMAERAMAAALTLSVDWTQGRDAIGDTLGTEGVALLRYRLKMATRPPRRVLWHRWAGTHYHRRRPYEAEARRSAIRDVRGSVLSWNDVYVYRWRTTWNDELIRPLRQPCWRFIARKAVAAGLAAREARRAEREAERERRNAAVMAARQQEAA